MTNPLLSSDFAFFDVTPDDRLYLNELTDEKLSLLAERYIFTENKDVRDEFRSKMTDPVWNKVREEIKKNFEGNNLSPELLDRVHYILNFEFPDSPFRFSTTLEYVDRFSNDKAENFSLFKESKTIKGTFDVVYRDDIGKEWQLFSDITITGRHHNASQEAEQLGKSNSQDFQYQSAMPYLTTRLTSKDDKYKFSLDAYYDHYFSPPPDEIINEKMVSASLQSSDMLFFGNPLSFTGRFNYFSDIFTEPPKDAAAFQRSENNKTGYAELTYKWPVLGLVMAYSYEDTVHGEQFDKLKSWKHSFSLLGQLTSSASYIRAGAGAGLWNGFMNILGNIETVDNDGKELHENINGQWVISDKFRFLGNTTVYQRESKGTFNGWYPAVVASLSGIFTPKHLNIGVEGGYEGQKIELNESQIMQKFSVNLNSNYTPTDSLSFTLAPGYIYALTEGYQANTIKTGYITATATYKPGYLENLLLLASWTSFAYSLDSQGGEFSGDIGKFNVSAKYQF